MNEWVSRRGFFNTVTAAPLACLLALSMPGLVSVQETKAKPNVLMIFVDDLNCRLGAYGDKVVKSPNIDALAQRGMRFDRAYCANPVCLPSRTAILTGLRSQTTRTLDNSATGIRAAVPDAVTLPQHFASGGYRVATVGKTFYSHNFDDPETSKILKQLESEKKPTDYLAHLLIDAEEKEAIRKLRRVYNVWGPLDCADTDMTDGRTALTAAKFLKDHPGGQPFFLAVGFNRPHLPLVVPKKYFDLYPLEALPQPEASTAHLEKIDDAEIGLKHAVSRFERSPTGGRLKIGADLRQRTTQAYYASISFMDAQVGVVLQGLKDAGLERNTVILFVSDHGYLLGEHQCWAKSSLYEESVRAPLILAAPGVTRPGSSCQRLVEFIDIYPTLAELCGLKPPAGVEGSSLVPLLKDPGRAWKQAAFSIDWCGERMVRTETWKLIVWPEGNGRTAGGLLFDEVNDPRENKNLYDSLEHQTIVTDLKKLLANGR